MLNICSCLLFCDFGGIWAAGVAVKDCITGDTEPGGQGVLIPAAYGAETKSVQVGEANPESRIILV
jgi:hypothetical protein